MRRRRVAHRALAGGSELRRYLRWQLPGWLVTGTVAWIAARLLELPSWTIAIVVGLVVTKDLALFPAIRRTLVPPMDPRPLGALGRVVEALAPMGQVRVQGELWRATTRDGGRLASGATVRVAEVRGLVLVVEPEEHARG